ncbi:hypothetical protein RHMOL_Rhmol09G0072400 [Rhododendron molle]|uniref:Uncharacterized protein n=1 Tax=Rhododendron molle TaxID=49168 RepID=A0ACC0MCN6_RHOML|nr:hypothetical protein RHMOL_Rhmol09G0072400 [Rhododendron molle]
MKDEGASSKPAQFCTSLPVQAPPVSNHRPPDPILGDLPKIPRCSSSPIPAPPSSDDLLPNPSLPSSASPSPSRSSEKPLTKSTHLHLSVVEGVAGGREIVVDAVVVEIAVEKSTSNTLGMRKSAAAAKGLEKKGICRRRRRRSSWAAQRSSSPPRRIGRHCRHYSKSNRKNTVPLSSFWFIRSSSNVFSHVEDSTSKLVLQSL